MRNLLSRCLRDERGTEVIDYALLVGLLILACIAMLGAFGIKVLDRWQRILDLI